MQLILVTPFRVGLWGIESLTPACDHRHVVTRYLHEFSYPAQFIPDQTPASLRWIGTCRGETFDLLPRSYVDLGCGPGITVAAVAAANPELRCLGADINPHHSEFLAALRDEAGLENLEARCTDFAELLKDTDFSPDIATARGILSWVPEPVREQLRELLGRLSPGGLAYLGFDSAPGHVGLAPLHDLTQSLMAETIDQEDYAKTAVAVLRELAESRADFLMSNPVTRQTLRDILTSEIGSIVHDLGVPSYQEFWVDEVVRMMATRGLRYVGTTSGEELTLNWRDAELAALSASAPGPVSASRLRELVLNPGFRTVLFRQDAQDQIAGPRLGSPLDLGVENPPVGWLTPPATIDWKRGFGYLEVDGEAVRELTPDTAGIDDLSTIPQLLGSTADIPTAVWAVDLIGSGVLQPLRAPAQAQGARASVDRFNRVAIDRAGRSDSVFCLLSAQSGNGVKLSSSTDAALAARRDGLPHPKADSLTEKLAWWEATLAIDVPL